MVIPLNRNPSPRELRWFGAVLATFLGVVGTIVYFRLHVPTAAVILWTVAILGGAAYYAIPSLRRPIFVTWMYLTYPIGWSISHLLLAFTYYAVLTPIGLA
ncbi:MAG TPA: hypothetical protein VIY86_07435, partial [Pirellulaceae bacterium]